MKAFKFLIVICFIYNAQAQHKEKTVELNELEIVNPKLVKILDFVSTYERLCDYYNQDLIFLIETQTLNENHRIKITTETDENQAFGNKIKGFFYKANHLFLVLGDEVKHLFKEKENIEKFDYLEYDLSYEEFDSEGRLILRLILDDSHSIWEFLYIPDNFIFEDFQGCNVN